MGIRGIFASYLVIVSINPQLTVNSSSPLQTIRDVTFGSSFKLVSVPYQIRLHSQDVKYGSGSGQQTVTGLTASNDPKSHWLIKGTSSLESKRGEPVLCGSRVKLEHQSSSKHLYSHRFQAPLSTNYQEISACEDNGDTGDIWEIICKESSLTWKRDETIELKHKDTKVFLSVSGRIYGRPIQGQYEIVGLPQPIESSGWTTGEGIFVHPSILPTTFHQNLHTEL